jgi:hypothetical protein
MGLITTSRVVTRSELLGRPCILQPGQQEWVTAIKCIRLSGYIIPPCIIFKGKVYIKGWFKELNLPDDWRVKLSVNK